MPASPTDLMAFAILAALKTADRRRAESALLMSMVPGPPARRAALATIAVGTQARDAVRRERKAAAAIISAISRIARGESAAHVLLADPTLCDLDAEEIFEQVREMWKTYGTPTFGLEIPREGDLWAPR